MPEVCPFGVMCSFPQLLAVWLSWSLRIAISWSQWLHLKLLLLSRNILYPVYKSPACLAKARQLWQAILVPLLPMESDEPFVGTYYNLTLFLTSLYFLYTRTGFSKCTIDGQPVRALPNLKNQKKPRMDDREAKRSHDLLPTFWFWA